MVAAADMCREPSGEVYGLPDIALPIGEFENVNAGTPALDKGARNLNGLGRRNYRMSVHEKQES